MLHEVPANERQVGGDHYKVKDRVEHWDLVELYGLGYLEGNATKYLSRHKDKGGRQDVEKALHYVEKLIEMHVKWNRRPRGIVPAKVVAEFTEGMGVYERGAINLLCRWDCLAHLEAAHKDITDLLIGL